MKNKTKFVFVTGGVVSSLGKGITSASLACLLKSRGYRVFMQKLDPYLNVYPGIMSPFQHGEVFLTDDGTEADLDLGHYERFAGVTCTKCSSYTSGKIYSAVLQREREGGYLGGTVQVIPHITNEIKASIRSAAGPDIDIVLCEIGGIAGDIESQPFLEAARQFRFEEGPNNTCFVHLTLVPFLRAAQELKTKPSQQSVAVLRSIGIIPDVLVCRTEVELPQEHRDKLALFCNVRPERVIEERDITTSVYAIPRELSRQHLDEEVLKQLNLPLRPIRHTNWDTLVRKATQPKKSCTVALVSRYASIKDAYKSVYESLQHAGMQCDAKVITKVVEPEELMRNAKKALSGVDGILVMGSMTNYGEKGKSLAAKFARENKIPYFGICAGMECAAIEFAENVLKIKNASLSDKGEERSAIGIIDEQRSGTTKLGATELIVEKGTKAFQLYKARKISERHRQRYAMLYDKALAEKFEKAGLKVSALSADGKFVELLEMPDHPFFMACQYHPEFKSRPTTPHPLFKAFIKTTLDKKKK
ncbi:CTP synthase [bacterium]|nr:CTP synthase [bacterium]